MPFVIIGQAVQDDEPHEPTSMLLTHLVPQRWYCGLQVNVHCPPAHTAVPLGSVGHFAHEGPHAVASLSRAHEVVPHMCAPVLQVKPQVMPSHVAPVAFTGTGHGEQLLPHALTSIVLGHDWPHAWVLAGHVPLQGAAWSMQAPRHSFLPVGQVPPQPVVSQVADPPFAGSRQGVHDVPQVCGLSFLTHPVVQRC